MAHGATHAFVAMLSFISKAGGFQSVVRCNPFLKLTFSHMQYSKKKKELVIQNMQSQLVRSAR